MSRVVFLLVPGLHLLDVAGPAQVLSTAADLGRDYALSYVAESADVPTTQGVPLGADVTWPELTPDDLVVVPGWRGRRLSTAPPVSAATVRKLAAHHAAGGVVASVCSGADVLGRAGLLDGRRCTTHHDLQERLAERYPRAHVVRDVLYVTDDRVVTSAGIASGIDLALHLVATADGPSVAARVAREMVVYARRNGGEPQASAMLRHRCHLDDAVHRVQDVIDRHFTERLRLAELAHLAACSERTLSRQFVRATGMTPLRYQQALRLERAEHAMANGATAEAAAREVGFDDARMLRRLRARGAPALPVQS